jgi:hypothetical protein
MHNRSAAKSTGLCLSVFIDPRCFEGMFELHRDGVVERKIILQLRSRTPSLLQDCASLPATFGFNCGIRDKATYAKGQQPTPKGLTTRTAFDMPSNAIASNIAERR